MRNLLSVKAERGGGGGEVPTREPMDLVVTDLFEIKGCHYLIILDVFTGYPWMKKMGKTPKTSQVTEALNEVFLTWGYPKHVKSDGGGQYRSEFQK